MVDPTETQHAHRESELETRDGSLDVSTFRDTMGAAPGDRDQVFGAERIGRYLVLSRLGAGAMGIVYAAYDPELDRKVALKLIKSARSAKSEAANARLLREAQALAKLDHPNVVPVHDAGDHQGQVFVAMKFVEGQTLDDWLEGDGHPPIERILQVFLDAGRGLAAAHARGLVHRDFKPENVMLESNGGVRVMDFGLVRRRDDDDDDDDDDDVLGSDPHPSDLRLTRTGALLGTPAYMAPELFEDGDATVFSDQFAFCVSLYEALYAERPYGGDSLGALVLSASEGKIRDAPSASKVPTWIRRILLRGLSPDPQARWPDMPSLLEALSDDPDARRRRVAVTGGGLLALGTLMVVAVTGLNGASTKCRDMGAPLEAVWNDRVRAEIDARIQASKLAFAPASWQRNRPRIDDWATHWVSARREACEDTHLRGEQSSELLDLRMACLSEQLQSLRATADVLVEANDQAIRGLSKITGALPGLEPCADAAYLRAEVRPPKDPAEIERVAEIDALIADAGALARAAKLEAARVAADEAWALAQDSQHGPTRVRARLTLAERQRGDGQYDAALENQREAYYEALQRRLHTLAARCARNAVFVLGYHMDRYDEALEWGRRAQANFGGEPDARLESHLGVALLRKGDYPQARLRLDRALELYAELDGNQSASIASVHMNLSALSNYEGKFEESLEHVDAALSGLSEHYGPEHPEVGLAHLNRGGGLFNMGKLEEGLAATERARDILEAALGPEHGDVALAYQNLGLMAQMSNRPREALEHTRRAKDVKVAVHGPESGEVADLWVNLSGIHSDMGQYEEAAQAARESLRIAEKIHGPEHQRVSNALNNLAGALARLGQLERAAQLDARCLAIRTKVYGDDHPMTAESLRNATNNLLALDRIDEAAKMAQRGLASTLATHGEKHPAYATALSHQARIEQARGHGDAAREHFTKALAIHEHAEAPNFADLVSLLVHYARFERGGGATERARELGRRAASLAERYEIPLSPESRALIDWAQAG